jgi:hypothetical protein
MGKLRTAGAAVVLACALSGCGAYVPEFGEAYDTTAAVPDALIDALIEHVRCEVKSQIEFLILDDIEIARNYEPHKRHLSWLDDWGGQLSLTLTVEEKTTLSPGVVLNKVLPNATSVFPSGNIATPQLETISLGATGSSDATRKAYISWFVDFREFTKEAVEKPSHLAKSGAKPPAKPVTNLLKQLTPELAAAKAKYEQLKRDAVAAGSDTFPSICAYPGGVMIEGDLKIRQWLTMTLRSAFVDNGVTGDFAKNLQNEIKAAKKDVLQNQITFVVSYSGNVTPGWKLVRVSANQSGNFFNAQRTRTQDLVVTLGPAPDDAKAAAVQQKQNQDLAAAIGLSVANAISGRTP